jgi:hypothetical protein
MIYKFVVKDDKNLYLYTVIGCGGSVGSMGYALRREVGALVFC